MEIIFLWWLTSISTRSRPPQFSRLAKTSHKVRILKWSKSTNTPWFAQLHGLGSRTTALSGLVGPHLVYVWQYKPAPVTCSERNTVQQLHSTHMTLNKFAANFTIMTFSLFWSFLVMGCHGYHHCLTPQPFSGQNLRPQKTIVDLGSICRRFSSELRRLRADLKQLRRGFRSREATCAEGKKQVSGSFVFRFFDPQNGSKWTISTAGLC